MSDQKLIAAIYSDHDKAVKLVESLSDQDFPMDQVSLLHKAGGVGDDPFGVIYKNDDSRMKVWGEQGAIWGALGGLLAGASGLVFVPGIGPLLAAGPIIEAIAGAALGAGVGASLMLGGAALTDLAKGLHASGVPEEKLAQLHQAVEDGKTLVLLHVGDGDTAEWKDQFDWSGADEVMELN